MVIGKRIYELRTERRLTQSQLANLADVSREQINRYENDKVTPDFHTIVKLANVFNVSVNSLLSGPEADRRVTDEDLRYALSATGVPLTIAQLIEVKRYAAYIQACVKWQGQSVSD